jgi:hypothetical protein
MSDATTLADLIARLEAATADQQAGLIKLALWSAVDNGWITPKACGRAIRMVDAEAYESAALTLVPDGWRWSLDWTQRPPYQDCGRADLYAPGRGIKPPDVQDVYAATPAIALCIAALKARSQP